MERLLLGIFLRVFFNKLSDEGEFVFNLSFFETEKKAIKKAKLQLYDLIILDSNFISFKGFESLKYTHKKETKVFLLLPVETNNKKKDEVLKNKADDMLSKPFNIEVLEKKNFISFKTTSIGSWFFQCFNSKNTKAHWTIFFNEKYFISSR